MNDDFEERFRQLPPDLDHPVDRFDLVRRRVERRRRRRYAAAAAAAIAVCVGVPVVLAGHAQDASSHSSGFATQPPGTPDDTTTAPPTEPATTGSPTGGVPGDDVQVDLADPVITDGIGTLDVELGTRPEGSTGVSMGIKCLSAGTIRLPDGSSEVCSGPDETTAPVRVSRFSVADLAEGQNQIEVRATPGTTWRLATVYVRTEFLPAPTNSSGQTYGPLNEHGIPDLVAVTATNGSSGYAYAEDYADPHSGKPFTIPVYLSDGETQIGTFHAN